MSRKESTNIESDQNNQNPPPVEPPASGNQSVDIQQELNRVEEMVLASPTIPLTRRTLVDEERLLDQLDVVRVNLPIVFKEAEAIVKQKKEIILQAQLEAEQIVETAKIRASRLLNETEILRQAHQEAKLLQTQVQQECELALEQNQIEIEQARLQLAQELEQMRNHAVSEALEIQVGADTYADNALKDIEQQLHDMLRVIQNGRNQLRSPGNLINTEETQEQVNFDF
jgi:cell division septum initiation protein DivIVA